MHLEELITTDLAKSGLIREDMLIADLNDSAMRACKLSTNSGYIIPYFTLNREPLGFYRVKMFAEGPKYRQMKGSPSHIYYPPTFLKTFKETGKKYIIITEGEKKAAAACKCGFPTVAVGGVDSWRSKILVLPADTDFYTHEGMLHAKLSGDAHKVQSMAFAPLAVGFKDLLELALDTQAVILICYDRDTNDTDTGIKFQVQRAAAELAFEFRSSSIPFKNIRQLTFPEIEGMSKIGIDDFLVAYPKEHFQKIIDDCLALPNAFPIHPDIAQVMKTVLARPKLPRELLQKIALMIVADLDARGRRMFCKESGQLFYFDNKSKNLIAAELSGMGDKLNITPFGRYLYRTYGIAVNVDTALINWVTTLFCGETPILPVNPKRVIAPAPTDVCNFQISDSYYVEVTAEAISLRQNGEKGNLFVAGHVEDCNVDLFLNACRELIAAPTECWWKDVFESVRLKDTNYAAKLHTLLYYISPWLLRWRGIQLPLEIITGEAGSGKSTLCELRLNIITGKPKLRNTPNELKDWQASVSNAGGLHITDNIQFKDKQLKQRLSDELCRIVTDPNPQIEARKLYSNADVYTIPVNCVFGFTGITNPFTANDVMQRAFILELDKSLSVDSAHNIHYDGNWKTSMLQKYGGREAWLAHHAVILQRFFVACKQYWDINYKASSRLVHLEQTLIIMANVLNMDTTWIPGYLTNTNTEQILTSDWALEGLSLLASHVRTFITAVKVSKENELPDYIRNLPQMLGAQKIRLMEGFVDSGQIANWAMLHDDYSNCTMLTRARSLGKYLQSNKTAVLQTCKIGDTGTLSGNKKIYKIYC